jgi:hypothetical protein
MMGWGDWGAFGAALDAFPGGTEDNYSEYFGNGTGISPNAQDWELYTGPKIDFVYEEQQNRPIAGVNMELRNYSPFTFRVIPPLIYLENPKLLTGSETGDVNLGIIEQQGLRGNTNPISSSNTWATSHPRTHGGGDMAFATGGRSPTSAQSTRGLVQPAISDMDTAMDIALQLEKILNCPPLTLFINPQSFEKSYSKVAAYQDKSRYGYIYQAWGEEQPTISMSGRIGAFIAGAPDAADTGLLNLWFDEGSGRVSGAGTDGMTSVPQGVQFASKRDSAAFQQLMALMTFYRNNGYIYDTLGNSEAHHLVGLIAIDYDQWTYMGNIDSFDWGYTEAQHGGGIDFSISFTAVKIYDNKTVQSGSADTGKGSSDTSGGFSVPPLRSPTPTGNADLRFNTSTPQETPLLGLGEQEGILTGKNSVGTGDRSWLETNQVNAKAEAAYAANRKNQEEIAARSAGTQGFLNESTNQSMLDDAHNEFYNPNTDYFGS